MGRTRTARLLDAVRQPAYTGDNRCLPCTVTNLAIAAVAAVVLGYAAVAAGGTLGVAGAVAGLWLAFAVGAIYLRGYLVPGTPELTKRYFPGWLLAAFGKADGAARTPLAGEDVEDVDVERVLLDVGVLEERPDGDLRLTSAFERDLDQAVATERDRDTGRAALADLVGLDPDELEFETYGDGAFVALTSGGVRIGRWESQAAFLADAAAARVLPEYYEGWDAANPGVRGQLLAGLRLFLERCPDCGGDVSFGQELVESCCSTHEVVAVTCTDCAARLFEVPVTDEMLAAGPDPAA